ncbi:hypothetical protein BC830DRAFT_1122003 [Chytriomyces sp. MP71]|nr:hypothetical protein BC830DRAFT_1122003 [Chytriomyces sp. MP71]
MGWSRTGYPCPWLNSTVYQWPEDYPYPPPPDPQGNCQFPPPDGIFPPGAPEPPGWPAGVSWPPPLLSSPSPSPPTMTLIYNGDSSTSSTTTLISIVCSVVLGVALICSAVVWLLYRRRRREQQRKSSQPQRLVLPIVVSMQNGSLVDEDGRSTGWSEVPTLSNEVEERFLSSDGKLLATRHY